VNVQSLRDTEGVPHLDIHPDDATFRQINDGDQVKFSMIVAVLWRWRVSRIKRGRGWLWGYLSGGKTCQRP
jgi:predicted molibdopterin-dependent oxidoreductase YjgC